jgi:formyltetrahydrofolate synthetase
MALLLRDAFLPNLVQTLEGNPAFVHCGPFANIAHGNSSVIADKIALSCSDYVVTEAGFGAEMGAQKALHIKSAASGIVPSCIVLNVTVRSMKLHGGGFSTGGGARPTKEEIELENLVAVRQGASTNLKRHIRNLISTKIPVIVSINKFSTDTVGEINVLKEEAVKAGANDIVIFEGHERGGKGAAELANAVVKACNIHDENNNPFLQLILAQNRYAHWKP